MRYQGTAWAASALLCLSGCGFRSYEEKPLQPEVYVADYESRSLSSRELGAHMAADGWPIERWTPARLEIAALYFSPAIAEARAQLAVIEAEEVTAGGRPGPGMGFAAEHHSDTPDGRTPWSAGPEFQIPIEGPGKRSARMLYAAARTQAAKIELDGEEWKLRLLVRQRALDIYDAEGQAGDLRARTDLLQEGAQLLTRRKELGAASDFEVSVMRLDAQRALLERGSAEARIVSAHSALAQAVGIPRSALDATSLDLNLFDEAPAAVPDVADLQRTALTQRSDVLRAIQEYAVSEAALRREIAGQYPDFVLTPGYFFDQADNVWSLATQIVMPLLSRNRGPIAEAEARRELAARRVEQLQAAVINEVHAAAAAFASAARLLAETDSIIAGTGSREEQVKRQFEAGEADRLEIVRAGIERRDASMIRRRFLVETWRNLFQLEDATQSELHGEVTP